MPEPLNLTPREDGRYYTQDPETGELYAGTIEDAQHNIELGDIPAPPPSQIEQDFSGFGGAVKAAGIAAARGAIPFIGADLVTEVTGYTEDGQRQIFEAQPVASIVGEAGGTIASIAALQGAGAVGALKNIGVFGRIARAAESGSTAAKVAKGVAGGAAYGIAGSDTSRILRGETETTARGLAGDIMTGAAVGAGISLLGALGGKAKRLLTPSGKSVSSIERSAIESMTSPMERKQAGLVLDGIRKKARRHYQANAGTIGEDTQRAIRDLVYPKGVMPLPPRIQAAAKSIIKDELEKKAAIAGLGHAAKELVSFRSAARAGAAGVAGMAFPALSPLIYGAGAVGILKSAVGSLRGPVAAQAAKIASRAINPMLGVTAKASKITGAAAAPARVSTFKAVDYVTADNYSEIRAMVDTAPEPQDRIMDLVGAGIPETEAANIAAHQEIVLDLLDRSLPGVARPRPETIEKANRVIDSIVNPSGVISRMSSLSMTAEDRDTMDALDPDTMDQIRDMIADDRRSGRMITPAERRQQDLIMGHSLGIRTRSIQQSIGAIQQPTKGINPPKLAAGMATTMQDLEV